MDRKLAFMRRVFLLLFAFVSTSVAAHDNCHDLWFTRNLVMDRAGYCFGSALGQAVFDNNDCRGKQVSLDGEAQQLVDQARRLEKEFGCSVDTSQSQLDLDDLAIRWQLVDLPLAEEFESACIGWKGPETPLHAARSKSSAVLGRVGKGDYLGFRHINVGDWIYVTVAAPDWSLKGGGWLHGDVNKFVCQNWAG